MSRSGIRIYSIPAGRENSPDGHNRSLRRLDCPFKQHAWDERAGVRLGDIHPVHPARLRLRDHPQGAHHPGFSPGGNIATAFSTLISATNYETNSRCSCAGETFFISLPAMAVITQKSYYSSSIHRMTTGLRTKVFQNGEHLEALPIAISPCSGGSHGISSFQSSSIPLSHRPIISRIHQRTSRADQRCT
jgi:hypothetical protein